MKILGLHLFFLAFLLAPQSDGGLPSDYKGKPYQDAIRSGPQTIPGRVQAAFYDLGGEGVAYHDTDPINHGSGELNYQPGHCEDGVSSADICHFREHEGVDISYVKKNVDLARPNTFEPEWQQLYIGWQENGEWTNYTVKVTKPSTYKIVTLYSNTPQSIHFSLNNHEAAECKLPAYPLHHDPDWMVWHTWNKAECGEITFPHAGLQLLTLHYRSGNNLAYFDFIPVR